MTRWKIVHENGLYWLLHDGEAVAASESPAMLLCCQPSFREPVNA